jgi:hypothetical protein
MRSDSGNDGITSVLAWITDRIDYAVTSVRLAIVDKICGPEPPTQADRQREAEKEQLHRAFPAIDISYGIEALN